jgi:hypothetical protein
VFLPESAPPADKAGRCTLAAVLKLLDSCVEIAWFQLFECIKHHDL